jgi:ribosome-binding protein aMBF1 (putative translation factor)
MQYNGFLEKRMNDMGWSIKTLAERLNCSTDKVKEELAKPSEEYKKRLMKALNISETEWLECVEHKPRKTW